MIVLMTRANFECPIFLSSERNDDEQTTNSRRSTLRLLSKRVVLYSETGNAKVDFLHIANKIARKVKVIYDRASIPTVTEYRTIQLIITYNDSCWKLRKLSNCKINK